MEFKVKIKNILILLSFIFSGCATTYKLSSLSDAEKAEFESLNKAQNEFEVKNEQAEEVWSRLNLFIANYSTLKTEISNNYTVKTYSPTSQLCHCGYNFQKEVKGKNTKFRVLPLLIPTGILGCHNDLPQMCERNTKLAVVYAKTGKLNPKFLNTILNGDNIDKY